MASLWILSGGLALRGPDGRIIAALNLAPYDGQDGVLFIGDGKADDSSTYAVHGAPGALFYR